MYQVYMAMLVWFAAAVVYFLYYYAHSTHLFHTFSASMKYAIVLFVQIHVLHHHQHQPKQRDHL